MVEVAEHLRFVKRHILLAAAFVGPAVEFGVGEVFGCVEQPGVIGHVEEPWRMTVPRVAVGVVVADKDWVAAVDAEGDVGVGPRLRNMGRVPVFGFSLQDLLGGQFESPRWHIGDVTGVRRRTESA